MWHWRFGLILLAALLPTGGAIADVDPDNLIAAAKAASGGAAWDKVSGWTEKGSLQASGLRGTYDSWLDLPGLKSTSDYALGPASGSAGWDGTKAWSTDSSKEVRVETSGQAIAEAIQDAYRSTYAFYFPDRWPAERVYAGKRDADGKPYDAVKITPKDAEPFELWFDPATHLIVREVQLTGVQPQTFIFSDWRLVNGVRVPWKEIQRVGGNPKFDQVSMISALSLSGAVPADRFAPPPPPANDAIWPADAASVTVPFRLLNNHIYVEASIDGKPPEEFVFDTGATDILDKAHAKAMGVKVEGALPGGGFGDKITSVGLAKVKKIAIGGLGLPDQVFDTYDSGGWIGVEGADSAGLLGYEFVKRAVLTIDYAGRMMTFTRPDRFEPPKGATAIPFTFSAHTPMVDATVDGIAGQFQIDTGSRGPLTLMGPFATKNGLLAKYHATRTATTGYGMGGPSRSVLGRVDNLTIGPVTVHAPVTEFVNDTRGAAAMERTAGNIGGDLLKRFTVTLDYGHQKLWLVPNALADQPDVFDRAGLWIARAADGTIDIADISNESAAAGAGLAVGDHIVAVDGHPAAGIQLFNLREQFKGAPGTKFDLIIRTKSGERHAMLTLADQV